MPDEKPSGDGTLGRRAAIRRLAILGAGGAAAPSLALANAAAAPAPPTVPTSPASSVAAAQPRRHPGVDPDLQNPELWWEKVLTREELHTLAVLCDVILPADERSPAASKLGVHDFIDEWVGAPYPVQQADQQAIRGGLSWLNTECSRRFGKPFAALGAAQKTQICDKICDLKTAAPAHRPGALMFERVRVVSMIGYYTSLEGMKDIGYVGNVPTATWDGPPNEILKLLKLV